MIRLFFRQYGGWILLYLLLAGVFYVTFLLYRLPMNAFKNSFLFSFTILFISLLVAYFRFSMKIRQLQHFTDSSKTYFRKPLEREFLNVIDRECSLILSQKEKVLHDTLQLKSVIKMWSHQIKVPLASLDLLVQTERLEKQQVALQIQSIQYYLTLLLNYMKFQEQQDDYRFELFDIRSIVVEIIKQYRIQFLSKNLSVQLEGNWKLQSDKKWLAFALSQIIDNAIKYSASNRSIRIVMQEGQICIEDQGIGILPEDLPRLFDEGFTGFNGHMHHRSTGLGLFMTKKIIDELHLSIRIQSEIDKGTSVYISKPKKEKTHGVLTTMVR